MNGYEAVMQLARERPEWLPAVRVCCEYPHPEFKGQYILENLPSRPGPNLLALVRCGVLESVRSVSGGHAAWYRLRDRDGAMRAIKEIGGPGG